MLVVVFCLISLPDRWVNGNKSVFSFAIMCRNNVFSISLQRKWAGLSIGQEVEGKVNFYSLRFS